MTVYQYIVTVYDKETGVRLDAFPILRKRHVNISYIRKDVRQIVKASGKVLKNVKINIGYMGSAEIDDTI